MVEQKHTQTHNTHERKAPRRILRAASITSGLGTILYAASAVDAFAHGENNAGIQQAQDTVRMVVITSVIVGTEIVLNKKR